MIRAIATSDTNFEWVVQEDGRTVARFRGFDGAFLAARYANRLRAEARS